MQAMAIFQNTSGHLVQTPAHLLPPQSCVDRVKPSFAVQSLKPFFFTMWSISRWTATLNNHQLLQPPVEVLAPSAPGLRGWPDRSSNMVTTKWREYLCIGYQSLLYPMPMVFGCKCLEAFFSGMVKGQLRPPQSSTICAPVSVAGTSQIETKDEASVNWLPTTRFSCHTSTRVRFSLGVSDAGVKLKYHTSVTQWACWLIFNPIKTLWAVRKANDQKIGIQWWYNA